MWEQGQLLRHRMSIAVDNTPTPLVDFSRDISDSFLANAALEDDIVNDLELEELLAQVNDDNDDDNDDSMQVKKKNQYNSNPTNKTESFMEKRVFAALAQACAFNVTLSQVELKRSVLSTKSKGVKKRSVESSAPSTMLTIAYIKPTRWITGTVEEHTEWHHRCLSWKETNVLPIMISDAVRLPTLLQDAITVDFSHQRHFFMTFTTDAIDALVNAHFTIYFYFQPLVPNSSKTKSTKNIIKRRCIGSARFPLHTVLFSPDLSFTGTVPIRSDNHEQETIGHITMTINLANSDGEKIKLDNNPVSTLNPTTRSMPDQPSSSSCLIPQSVVHQPSTTQPPSVAHILLIHLHHAENLVLLNDRPLRWSHASPFNPNSIFTTTGAVVKKKDLFDMRKMSHTALIPLSLSHCLQLSTSSMIIEAWQMSSTKSITMSEDVLIGVGKLSLGAIVDILRYVVYFYS